jgi:hypothetical protein
MLQPHLERRMQTYVCPVCGFPGLDHPAWDPQTGEASFTICPCCGCEFGYDDATTSSRDAFRRRWLKAGAPWFSPERKPVNWNLPEQLANVGLNPNDLRKY